MQNKMQNRIDGYFEKLTEFISKLPLSDKGKNYLWYFSYCQFYYELTLSENGKTTYGIQTEWQLQRFIEQFKKNFQKLRLKAVEEWTDKLHNIESLEAVNIIDKHIYRLRKKDLLAEIGADGLNDWEKWLQKYLSNELYLNKKRPVRKLSKQQKKTSYLWLNNPEKELLELYKLLNKDYNLIASETTFNQFKGVFTGQPIESINPIKWIASKSLNAYFIEQLINKNKLSKVINTDIWEISKYCFYNGTNFSQLIDNYNNSKTGKPKNYNLIDDLLNAL